MVAESPVVSPCADSRFTRMNPIIDASSSGMAYRDHAGGDTRRSASSSSTEMVTSTPDWARLPTGRVPIAASVASSVSTSP